MPLFNRHRVTRNQSKVTLILITYLTVPGFGKTKKKLSRSSVDETTFLNSWHEIVTGLKDHIHRKRIQVAVYNQSKANLKQGEAILYVDYSEFYKNKQQYEIQSAYFGQSTFSIFTACVYRVDDCGDIVKRPITVVSESSDHSTIAALTLL